LIFRIQTDPPQIGFMRFRLRTLMIVLALGPPILAGLWIVGRDLILGYPLIALVAHLAIMASPAIFFAIVMRHRHQ
jgi:hypothetical protein